MTEPFRASVLDLPRRVGDLPAPARGPVERLFLIQTALAELDVPATMEAWVRDRFGSLEAVRRQPVVRVTNRLTLEDALFNPLRGRRPRQAPAGESLDAAGAQGDPFCRPLEATPAHPFGRVRGRHAVSAANVAAYEGRHAVIISDEHDPWRLDEERVLDYLRTAWRWAQEAHRQDPEARYYLLVWNGLWRAGASLVHGHLQVVLARGAAYGRVETWRRALEAYGPRYFADLAAAHHDLGLGLGWHGVEVLAHLTPQREREVLLVAPAWTDELGSALHHVLAVYRGLGVESFNVGLYHPPLSRSSESWEGFPLVFRIVDRGPLASRTSDVGGMELFAASVVSHDPYELVEPLRRGLEGGTA